MNPPGDLNPALFAFGKESLQAVLMLALLTHWTLAGIFSYIYRYTKRRYVSHWISFWMFSALACTLELLGRTLAGFPLFLILRDTCWAAAFAFLICGSLNFFRQWLPLKLISGFLVLFSGLALVCRIGPEHLSFLVAPVYMWMGSLASVLGLLFFRLAPREGLMAGNLLGAGCLAWGFSLGLLPFVEGDPTLATAGWIISTTASFVLAMGMIILAFEETRARNEASLSSLSQLQTGPTDFLEIEFPPSTHSRHRRFTL